MKPAVVVDSTTLSNVQGFESADWSRLLALSETEQIELIVPELVLMEVGRQWQESLDKASENLLVAHAKRAKSLSVLGYESPDLTEAPDLDRRSYVFEMKSVLERYKVQITDLPEKDIRQLVEQDLDSRKPFSRDGRGFRDALIWEAVIETNDKEDSLVFFVSGNITDFCSATGGLHEELLATLDDPASVLHAPDLKGLFEMDPLKELVQELETIQRTLTDDTLIEKVEVALEGLIDADFVELVGEYAGKGVWEIPHQILLDEPMLTSYGLEEASLASKFFRSPRPEEYVIEVAAVAYCYVEGYINKSELWRVESDNISILDSDFNKHVALAGQELKIQFRFVSHSELETLDEIILSVDHAEVIDDEKLSH